MISGGRVDRLLVGYTPVGLSRYARSIPLSEFVSVASAVRLGLALGLISSRGLKSHAGGFGAARPPLFTSFCLSRVPSLGVWAWTFGAGLGGCMSRLRGWLCLLHGSGTQVLSSGSGLGKRNAGICCGLW